MNPLLWFGQPNNINLIEESWIPMERHVCWTVSIISFFSFSHSLFSSFAIIPMAYDLYSDLCKICTHVHLEWVKSKIRLDKKYLWIGSRHLPDTSINTRTWRVITEKLLRSERFPICKACTWSASYLAYFWWSSMYFGTRSVKLLHSRVRPLALISGGLWLLERSVLKSSYISY